MNMKNKKIILGIIVFILCLFLCLFLLNLKVYGFIAKPATNPNVVISNTAPASEYLIISRGAATVLKVLQVLQYALPVVFFVGMVIFNIIKKNNKNTVLNILKYLVIAVLIFFATIGIGTKILNKNKSYGYSSKTIDFIEYNGEVIYYHR